MNILILGSGIVGANLAKKLSEQGKNVFLLDDDANELKNLAEVLQRHHSTPNTSFLATAMAKAELAVTCPFTGAVTVVVHNVD